MRVRAGPHCQLVTSACCDDACTDAATQCNLNAVETCGLGSSGCYEWTVTQDCSTTGLTCDPTTVSCLLGGSICDLPVDLTSATLPLQLRHLGVTAGTTLADVKRVVSFPDAMEQCRAYFARELPNVELVAANSTSEAARLVGEDKPAGTAALGTALAARLYGLDVIGSGPDLARLRRLAARNGDAVSRHFTTALEPM